MNMNITLPDGKVLEMAEGASGFDVAFSISPGLAKKAIGVKINNDEIRDLKRPLDGDCELKLILADDEDEDALFLLRHSAAHVMAEAICEIVPGTQLAYGPPIDNGFYYDIKTPRPLTDADFPAIEKKMNFIIKQNKPFTRCEYNVEEGMTRVEGDKYKTDNAERAVEKGSETLSFYSTGQAGEAWEDLCAGPHVPSTKFLSAFKIQTLSGAYWKGDQNSDQLTRVYGTCFADKKNLKKYLHMIEEAKKRDHRKIGKEMNLFSFMEDHPGHIFWHPRGWSLYQTVLNYVRTKLNGYGYQEVNTPTMMPQFLWERSGHWAKYQENMFITKDREQSEDPKVYALKPMNCPGHTLVYNQLVQSYRDLPLRMAEFGTVMRFEPTGALHGIFRARSFTQDDGHIFCTEDQLGDEVVRCCEEVRELYRAFGYDPDSIKVKFSTRPEVRIGSDESWDLAEDSLRSACEQANLNYEVSPGEGAFYGPKLEFTLIDCLGREWQCGTIQVDYLLASKERLNVDYVGADNEKHNPVIIHRALLGSFERFIGIMIEHYEGKFPLWLAPEQVRVLQITDAQSEYSTEVTKQLRAAGFRVEEDKQSDKLGAKIRRARTDRVPYFLVLGKEEMENGTVAVQKQNGDKVGTFSIAEFIEQLKEEAKVD